MTPVQIVTNSSLEKLSNKVIDIMKNLGHEMNTTFVVATHDARMASRCDRTIELLDGKLHQFEQDSEVISWAS